MIDMGFDFLTDDANLVLDVCTRAEKKKEEYIKTLKHKPNKKELEDIEERFVLEELKLLNQNKYNKNRIVKEKDAVDCFENKSEDEFDDLELDEMMDVWDEEEGDL